MTDEFITIAELFELIAVFVGPFLLVGGIIQYRRLRRAGIATAAIILIMTLAATVTIAITWGVMSVVPTLTGTFGYGGQFLIPATIATATVTALVWYYASRRSRTTS